MTRPSNARRGGARAPPGLALALVVGAAFFAPVARANDRPYQVARTAVLEDDEKSWSLESWVQRFGSVRGVSVEPEYIFGGGDSVQIELTRYLDRSGRETGHEAEIELKRIFNDVHCDGWGWALSAAFSAERGNDGGGTIPALSVKLPVSIALGGGYLHVNVGVAKASDSRLDGSVALGIEQELGQRTMLFGEAARSRDDTFLQVGVRQWIRREKLALDFSVQQQRTEGLRRSGFIIGIGIYDF